MTVGEVREDDCDVVDEFGNGAALTFATIARSARLAWAITIDSSHTAASSISTLKTAQDYRQFVFWRFLGHPMTAWLIYP